MKIRLVGLYKKDSSSDIYFASKECISRANSKEYLQFNLLTKSEIENKINML